MDLPIVSLQHTSLRESGLEDVGLHRFCRVMKYTEDPDYDKAELRRKLKIASKETTTSPPSPSKVVIDLESC